MPQYLFECEGCGATTTLTLSVTERNEDVNCPNPDCSELMKRIPAASNFHLRGNGWAYDNYGLRSKQNDNG